MPKSDAKSDLLREGCKSYHLAVFALYEFRCEIQKLFRETLKGRAEELAEATKLDKRVFIDGVKEYRNPPKDDPDGPWAEIGLRIPKKTWTFWVYLYVAEPGWDYPTPALYVQIELKERGVLRERLSVLRDEVTFEGSQRAWIAESISVDDSFDLTRSLDRLIERWIAIWRKVGGMKPLLSEARESKSKALE